MLSQYNSVKAVFSPSPSSSWKGRYLLPTALWTRGQGWKDVGSKAPECIPFPSHLLRLLQLGFLELELRATGQPEADLVTYPRGFCSNLLSCQGDISSQFEAGRALAPSTALAAVLADSPKELCPGALLASQNTALTLEISTALTPLSLTARPLAIYLAGGLVKLKKQKRGENDRIPLGSHPCNCHGIPLQQTLSPL